MAPTNRVGQRHQINDRVRKKTLGGGKPTRYGTIIEPTIKTDSRGYKVYYYHVQWDDLQSPSLHAQHVLIPLHE